MSTLKVGTIQDHANSNTAITIDSSGRVTEPAKPCFAVMNDRGVTANFSTITDVPFNVIEFQRGGTVVAISGSGDTTSAVFTAPITGIYQFNMSINLQNAGGGTFSSSYLYIDGVQVGVPDKTYRSLDTNDSLYHSLTSAFAINLNANQTVTPRFHTSGDTSSTIRIGARFSGFLIA